MYVWASGCNRCSRASGRARRWTAASPLRSSLLNTSSPPLERSTSSPAHSWQSVSTHTQSEPVSHLNQNQCHFQPSSEPMVFSPGLGHFKRRSEKGRPGEVGLGPPRLESQALCKTERLQPGPYDKSYSRKKTRERSLDRTDRESPSHAAYLVL